MMAEQTAIEARLLELEGVDIIQSTLRQTHIRGEEDMAVDPEPEPYVSPALRAKQKALSKFVSVKPKFPTHPTSLTLDFLLSTDTCDTWRRQTRRIFYFARSYRN